jgi:hypothetical protein
MLRLLLVTVIAFQAWRLVCSLSTDAAASLKPHAAERAASAETAS